MATAENPRANFENRTIWTADNLPVLRGLNDDCVDLVYADPPFKTERRYTAADSSNAAGAGFRDTWRHRDEDPADREAMARTDPAALAVIDASTAAHGGGMRTYLAMMAVRLIELRRVLKPTGTLYLHCDDNADGYLRILCDAVMGAKRFRNAIVWKRSTRTRSRGFGRTHDTVLAYSPGNGTWNEIRMAEPCEGSDRFYTESDTRGRYKRGDLTGAGVTGGESGRPWRDHDPSAGQPALGAAENRRVRRMDRGQHHPRIPNDQGSTRQARRSRGSWPDPPAETGPGLADAEALPGGRSRSADRRCLRRHRTRLEPLPGVRRLPDAEAARARRPAHRRKLEPRRHDTRAVLRMRDRMPERRVPGSALGGHRHLADGNADHRGEDSEEPRTLRRDPPTDGHPRTHRPRIRGKTRDRERNPHDSSN